MRLGFVVEGETEHAFIMQILRPHLYEQGITIDSAHVITVKGNRWTAIKRALHHLFGRMGPAWDVRVTTVYDLYGIDRKGLGIADALTSATQATQRAQIAEDAMSLNVGDERFMAHVSVHELEALIFTDLNVTAVHPDCRAEVTELARQVQGLEPEAINDRRETSPSHRLLRATTNRYNKVVDGPSILKRIGLLAMRARCPHFASWLGAIERLRIDS